MTLSKRALGAVAGLGVVLSSALAAAEPSSTERAAAETLFQQGSELLASKQLAQACEKFEASQQLDPALGTLLRLADCYDRVGKTASAWTAFRDAASLAGSRNEAERQRIASERANDLEKRMPKIELKVDAHARSSGLELRLNGANIPAATWDTPLPVDPGRQKIEASAPGKVTFSTLVDIAPGAGTRAVEIPALLAKPVDTTHPVVAAGGHEEERSAAPHTQRTVGFVLGGVGLVGAGIGAFLGYRAHQLNQSSLDQCRASDANACTQEGADLRDSARHWATGSTVSFVAAGALLVGGTILIFTGGSNDSAKSAWNVTASPSLRGGNVMLRSSW